MIDKLKSKLKELVSRKKEMQPKLDDINSKREIELQNVNKKFDHMVYDINYNIQKIEDEFYNDLIRSFVEIVTQEFDAKRSTGIYEITDNFKTYRKLIAEFDMFPKDLIQKMHEVINGEPIEDIVYELDDIQKKYMKS